MSALTGKKVKDTYKDLLQISNANAGVDTTLRTVEDGEGTASALKLSTAAAEVDGDLTVDGLLEIEETATPGTPPAGFVGISANQNTLYQVDESGVVKQLVNASAWGTPIGGALLNGTSQYYTVSNFPLNPTSASFHFFVNTDTIAAVDNVIADFYDSNNYFRIYHRGGGNLGAVHRVGGVNMLNLTIGNVFTVGKDTLISVIYDGVNINFYKNLTLINTTAHTSALPSISTLNIGRTGANNLFWLGVIRNGFVFNKANSYAELVKIWNNGKPEEARLPFADIGASQTALTSGTLTIGKRYIIDSFQAGDDFSNVATVISGTINTSGCVFIATGTTPTTWANSSSLRSQGCVFELRPENAGVMGWLESMNGLHAVSAGNPIALSPLRDYKSAIGTTAVEMVKSQKIQTVLKGIIPTTASGTPTTISLGTTSGATELLNGVAYVSGKFYVVDSYSTTERSLFIKVDSGTVNVIFIYEKVAL